MNKTIIERLTSISSGVSRGRAAVALAALLAGAAVASDAAAEDIWTKVGLTGGSNGVVLTTIVESGEITFNTKTDDFGGVVVKKGAKAHFAAQCKRSGYRCARIKGFTNAVFDTKHSQEEGDVEANLVGIAWGRDSAKNKAAAVKTLKAACAAGQAEVQLPVAVRLVCEKVKFAIGDSSMEAASEALNATYKVTCN